MHQSPLDRFKVMLEDHNHGTVTQKQYALRDVLKLIAESPGGLGRGIIDKEVDFGEEYTEVATIPKNSKILSAAVKVIKGNDAAGAVKLVFDDETTVLGQTENGKTGQKFAEWGSDQEPSEDELHIGLIGESEGRARVVIVYDTLNEIE